MKTVTVFFVALTILFSSLSKSILFFHYQANKAFYSLVLCENKAKPKMHCNGHCKLAKELKEADKKSNVPVNSLKSEKQITLFAEAFNDRQYYVAQTLTKFQADNKLVYSTGNSNSVFQPPEC